MAACPPIAQHSPGERACDRTARPDGGALMILCMSIGILVSWSGLGWTAQMAEDFPHHEALCAKDGETSAPRKFKLEGAGEPSRTRTSGFQRSWRRSFHGEGA